MHQPALPHADEFAIPSARMPRSTAAFSLVEVTLAIGIIAFAFVALFGLLPTGLTTFRSAIDTANETWITQSFNSMVQTTDFKHIRDLSFEESREIYYFDEQGKLTDTKQHPSATEEVIASHLYATKLFVEKLYRPEGKDGKTTTVMPYGLRVSVIMAPVLNLIDFENVKKLEDMRSLPPNTTVRVRTFLVAQMDSEKQ